MKLPEPENSIAALIDRAVEGNREEARPHLGASLLGHPCDRWLWLTFRWAVIEQFPGRILRLFARGQREEENLIQLLESIDIEFEPHPEQARVDFGAHVSGSVDGIILGGVPEAPKKKHIAEFKTHSLKSFNDLCAKGVQESKSQHWCQMQLYMKGTGIDRALYVAICKDDDRIYTERVRYDKEAAEALVARGHRITLSERLLEPLSADPTWYQCKFCAAHDFCHVYHCTREINCRTCAHSTALVNSTWTCALYENAEIPLDAQRTGCAAHVLHPDLVPWKVLPSEDGRTALYEINGVKYRNGEGDMNVYESRELLSMQGIVSREEKGEDVLIPF